MSRRLRLIAGRVYLEEDMYAPERLLWLDRWVEIELLAWYRTTALRELKPTNDGLRAFIYRDDGNSRYLNDANGPLKVYALDDVIAALEKDCPDGHYAIDCLKGMRDFWQEESYGRFEVCVILFHS